MGERASIHDLAHLQLRNDKAVSKIAARVQVSCYLVLLYRLHLKTLGQCLLAQHARSFPIFVLSVTGPGREPWPSSRPSSLRSKYLPRVVLFSRSTPSIFVLSCLGARPKKVRSPGINNGFFCCCCCLQHTAVIFFMARLKKKTMFFFSFTHLAALGVW